MEIKPNQIYTYSDIAKILSKSANTVARWVSTGRMIGSGGFVVGSSVIDMITGQSKQSKRGKKRFKQTKEEDND